MTTPEERLYPILDELLDEWEANPNLATVPAGEGAAVVLYKAILGTLYGAAAVPGGDPAQAPTTTTPAGRSSTTR